MFFNALLNLTKLIAYDERDPFQSKADQDRLPDYNDWDKFALNEYQRLAVDESDEDEAGADLMFEDSGDEHK